MASEEDRLAQFEAAFEQTSSMIYNLGLRLFRNEEDALDFAQDVYLRAYDRLDSFRGESKLSTWLYSLGMNLGLNRLKKQKRLQMRAETDERASQNVEELLETNPDSDPLASAARSEQEHIVREELQELPDVYRIPLLLFYYEQMQYADIAERLGEKEGTLKSYLHRGRRLLRDRLVRRGVEP